MIKSLKLENFRAFKSAGFSLSSRSVVVSGENGQGKSTVLEAIYLLGNLRSFRTTQLKELRSLGSDFFKVECELQRSGAWISRLEIADFPSRQLKIDGAPVSKASDFVRKFKTVCFLPDDPILVSGPSQLRRRFLDMFVSMVSQDYFISLQRYFSALRSRNCILKSGSYDDAVLDSYDTVLSSAGARINSLRRFYMERLSDAMKADISEIRPELSKLSLKLKASQEGDDEGRFRERLSKDRARDKLRGFTGFGPHLDDFEISVDAKPLRNYGSRGQCRIASLCLKLAEFELVLSSNPGQDDSVAIVDDSTGDLDQRAKDAFFERISKAGQIFYAFTSVPEEERFKNSQTIKIRDGKVLTE